MHCKITSNSGNWRLSLIHLLKFLIIIFCAYGALLSTIPAIAAYSGITYDWMPDSRADMFILIAAATVVIISYYHLYDTYDLTLRSDLVIFGLILLISACSMDPQDLGIYALVMLPMIIIYNRFSDIHHTLIVPKSQKEL
jgi:hypothetical protein